MIFFLGECAWLHLDLIASMQKFCRTLYPSVGYAYTTIPTYPSGQIGFILCSLNPVSLIGTQWYSHNHTWFIDGSGPVLN